MHESNNLCCKLLVDTDLPKEQMASRVSRVVIE